MEEKSVVTGHSRRGLIGASIAIVLVAVAVGVYALGSNGDSSDLRVAADATTPLTAAPTTTPSRVVTDEISSPAATNEVPTGSLEEERPTTTALSVTSLVVESGQCSGIGTEIADPFVIRTIRTGEFEARQFLCDQTTGEEIELLERNRSLRCNGDTVAIRDFELPTSARNPIMSWTETQAGVVTNAGTLDLRYDYLAAAAIVSNVCDSWDDPQPFFRAAPHLLGLLLDELGFTDVEGDHAIDPTWAASGDHAGQTYGIGLDIDFQRQYEPGGDWRRDCEVGLLTFTPEPSPELLLELVELAGCPA
jgi:hypothetical protein